MPTTATPLRPATEGRHDLYGPIHKGLRRAHGVMLTRLGAADFAGDEAALLADLRAHLALAAIHLVDEEAFIHTALAARSPGAPARLEDQHADHRASFAMLEVAIRGVEGADGGVAAVAAGRRLYLAFSRFVADDFEHMAEEECETWPLLCALFSDAELQGMERAIVANLDPGTNMAFLRQVLPAANHPERAALLAGIRAEAPPPAFAAMMEELVPALGARERGQLAAAGLLA